MAPPLGEAAETNNPNHAKESQRTGKRPKEINLEISRKMDSYLGTFKTN